MKFNSRIWFLIQLNTILFPMAFITFPNHTLQIIYVYTYVCMRGLHAMTILYIGTYILLNMMYIDFFSACNKKLSSRAFMPPKDLIHPDSFQVRIHWLSLFTKRRIPEAVTPFNLFIQIKYQTLVMLPEERHDMESLVAKHDKRHLEIKCI